MAKHLAVPGPETSAVILEGRWRHRWTLKAWMACRVRWQSYSHIACAGSNSVVIALLANGRVSGWRRRWIVNRV
jgi:hypothetical protein